jgi:ABC-type enterochelin transport system substrate-binding protein
LADKFKALEPSMHQMIRTAVVLLTVLVLAACGQNRQETEQEAPPIEQQVQQLQLRLDALERRHAQDIEDVRTDLKNVLTYMNIALQNIAEQNLQEGPAAPEEDPKEENGLKRSLEQNLRMLLDLSREMINRLERELDQSFQKDEQQGRN